MHVATGSFTGNGTSQSIGGLTFTPLVVFVWRTDSTAAQPWIRTSSMAAGDSSPLVSGGILTGRITSLDIAGFSVGSNGDVNNNMSTQYWIAFGDDGSSDLSCFSYTGTGSSLSLTTPGFLPKFVLVVSGNSHNHLWRTADMPTNTSNLISGANTTQGIRTLDPTGFTMGTSGDGNTNGQIFHAVAMAGGQVATFGYTGNGSDNRNVGSFTFTPVMAWTQVSNGSFAFRSVILHTDTMPTDTAKEAGNSGAGTSDLIQDLGAGTIQVGTKDYVNANGYPYTAAVWSATAPGATVTASVMTASATMLNAVITGDANVAASVMQASAQMPTGTVIALDTVNISATAMQASAVMLNSSVDASAIVSGSVMQAIASMLSATIDASAIVTTTPMQATARMPDVAIRGFARTAAHWITDTFFGGHAHIGYLSFNPKFVLHIADSDDGTFTLTYDGDTTTALAFDTPAAPLQAALEALSSIGVGNILVTGGPGSELPFIFELINDLAGIPSELFISNGTGLLGPEGLNPRATVERLCIGFSEDDDFGELDEVTVVVFERGYPITYEGRVSGLSFSEADYGGDERAQMTVIFTPPYDGDASFPDNPPIPKINDVVIIVDKRGGFWIGWLETPAGQIDAVQAVFNISARGLYTASHDIPYQYSRKFMDGDTVDEIFTAVRNELMGGSHFSINNDFISSGKTIEGDTPDLYKKYAAAIFSEYGSLGNLDDRPMVYGAKLGGPTYPTREAILYLEPEVADDSGPDYIVYLRDGIRVDPAWDANEIVNRYIVEYQNDKVVGYGISDHPTSPGEVDRLKIQFADGLGASSVAESSAWGTALVTRHGAYVSSSCTITIPGSTPVFLSNGHVIPNWRMRPNKIIEVADWPAGLPPIDWRISNIAWEQQSGTVTATTGRAQDVKRAIRKVAKQEIAHNTQPGDITPPFVTPRPDKNNPVLPPWLMRGIDAGGDPANPEKVHADQTSSDIRAVNVPIAIRTTETERPCLIPFDGKIVNIFIGSDLVNSVLATVIVGIGAFSHYSLGPTFTFPAMHLSGVGATDQLTDLSQPIAAKEYIWVQLIADPEGEEGTINVQVVIERGA